VKERGRKGDTMPGRSGDVICGSRVFLGGLRDKFIWMCNDCIAVKTQLLR